jgi:hypothetical protein
MISHDEGNPCRDFFEKHHGTSKLVPLLQAEPNRIGWEGFSASKYSPGIVAADERLSRIVIRPTHVDRETGEIKPTEFFQDARDKGCSSDRLSHCTMEQSVAFGRARADSWNVANPEAVIKREVVASITLDQGYRMKPMAEIVV